MTDETYIEVELACIDTIDYINCVARLKVSHLKEDEDAFNLNSRLRLNSLKSYEMLVLLLSLDSVDRNTFLGFKKAEIDLRRF